MSSSITCVNCGAPGNPADRFCASCGAPRPEIVSPITAPPAVATVAPPPPPLQPQPQPYTAAVGTQPGRVGGGQPSTSFDAKGFLRSLYDFGFTSLITPKVIRFVYALLVIINSIGAVLFLLGCLASRNGLLIVFGLIFVPVFYLVYMILLRITMELIVVFFKMGDDVHAIRNGASPV
jgi:Domain of unknown function (DUF4282)